MRSLGAVSFCVALSLSGFGCSSEVAVDVAQDNPALGGTCATAKFWEHIIRLEAYWRWLQLAEASLTQSSKEDLFRSLPPPSDILQDFVETQGIQASAVRAVQRFRALLDRMVEYADPIIMDSDWKLSDLPQLQWDIRYEEGFGEPSQEQWTIEVNDEYRIAYAHFDRGIEPEIPWLVATAFEYKEQGDEEWKQCDVCDLSQDEPNHVQNHAITSNTLHTTTLSPGDVDVFSFHIHDFDNPEAHDWIGGPTLHALVYGLPRPWVDRLSVEWVCDEGIAEFGRLSTSLPNRALRSEAAALELTTPPGNCRLAGESGSNDSIKDDSGTMFVTIAGSTQIPVSCINYHLIALSHE
jgi:hypothetical protein